MSAGKTRPAGRVPRDFTELRGGPELNLAAEWLVPDEALRQLLRVAIGAVSPTVCRLTLERQGWTHRDAVDFVKLGEDALLELKLATTEQKALEQHARRRK